MNPIDLKITELYKQEFKNLQQSQLILEFNGKTSNTVLVNTFRRCCYDYIPTYAFPSEGITIDKNTSITNNDMMRLRLSQITIPKIKNKIHYLEDKFWKGVIYNDPNREKHQDDKKVLELYITATNNTNDIMSVTTEYAKVYEDGTELKDKFDSKFPCLIIKLRPGEVFSCRCLGILGIGKNNNIWAGSGNGYFEDYEDDPHRVKLTLESQGQFDEYELMYKSCIVLKEKLKLVKNLAEEKYDLPEIKDSTVLNIVLENEDHTIGNLINEYLQVNKNIIYSGLSKPNLVVDTVIIKFESVKNDPIKPFLETINYIIDLINHIEIQIVKLGGKYINK